MSNETPLPSSNAAPNNAAPARFEADDVATSAHSAALLQELFDGTITEEAATELLDLWDRSPDLEEDARAVFFAERALRMCRDTIETLSLERLADWKKDVCERFHIPSVDVLNLDDRFFENLVRMEKGSPALPTPVRADREERQSRQDETASFWERRRLSWITRGIVGAALLCIITVLYFQFSSDRREYNTNAPVRLTSYADARWDGGQRFFSVGEPFGSQGIDLTEGLASFRLLRGASVIAQGPAEFSVCEKGHILCKSGRFSLDVPPQKEPLRVSLPQLTVIVRGTRFSVEASALGSEVHLYEGRVEVEHGQGLLDVQPGQSILITNRGDIRRLDADETQHVSVEQMKQKAAEFNDREKQRNRQRWETIRSNPALISGLNFETIPATWNNTSLSAGRLPGTRALDTRNSDFNADIPIDRELNAVTLAAWVRLDGFARDYCVILTSSPFRQGGLRWQIEKDGVVRLLLPNNVSKKPFEGCRVFQPARQGIWTHLAVCADVDSKTIDYYVNGAKVHEESRDTLLPFRIDRATLGNASVDDRRGARTALQGAVDELLIFDRKLDENEIRDLIR